MGHAAPPGVGWPTSLVCPVRPERVLPGDSGCSCALGVPVGHKQFVGRSRAREVLLSRGCACRTCGGSGAVAVAGEQQPLVTTRDACVRAFVSLREMKKKKQQNNSENLEPPEEKQKETETQPPPAATTTKAAPAPQPIKRGQKVPGSPAG